MNSPTFTAFGLIGVAARRFACAASLWAALSSAGPLPAGAADAVPEPPGSCRQPDRPSVGLALSGGGARGGAHIGVLAALEELRVPIDCIAGTSVGAAIGGFYAAGLRPDEIERIARAIDWDAAFSNAMPRPDRSFRRKHDDFLFLVNFQPGLRARRIALPVGFVQGQVIDMTLSRAIGGSYPTPDFDRLPIPFRAVATDMTTGEAVVLGSGDLALALRASMSLPAVLAPIDLDGRMLADGGLAMNLPVSAVQALGADVVLAVDASSALLEREKMRSVLDVTSQLTTLMTRPAMEQQKRLLRAGDILLTPVLETPQTFMSFATFDRTIGDGYRAVMDQRERFAAWSLDVERYAAYLADRHRARGLTPPRVDFVRLDNRSSIADRVIEARIGGIALGAPLDVPAVEAAVRRVYGLGLFQNVRYSVVATDAGTTGVEIRVDERAWGPSYFQMGLHYASSSTADTLFGVAASYLRTGINERGGEWRATVALGDEPEALADFYQPLGPEAAFFVEAQFAAESSVYNVFSGDSVSTAFDVRQTGLEASAGRVLGDTVELRAGLRSGEGAYHLRIGDPSRLPGGDFRRREVFVRLESDKLDSVAFPRAGSSSSVEWHSSRPEPLEGARFQQLSVRFQAARTWRRHTVLGTVRYDTTVSGDAPLYARFRVGGFRDLSGLTRGELVGQNAARIGLSYYREIGDFAMFPAFAGVSLERGNVWDDRRAIGYDDAIGAASLWAGIATPIGPVYLGAGRTGDGRRAVYLSLGGSF